MCYAGGAQKTRLMIGVHGSTDRNDCAHEISDQKEDSIFFCYSCYIIAINISTFVHTLRLFRILNLNTSN